MKSDKGPMVMRAYLLYIGFIIITGIGLYKTLKLQLNAKEANIPIRSVDRFPRMGEILDVNLNPLVTSVSYYDIHMDPTVVKKELFDQNIVGLSEGLATLFPEKDARTYENEIRKARSNNDRYYLIHKKVTNEQREKIKKLPIFNLGKMKGGLIDNEEIIVRKFTNGDLLKRTLGYYNRTENLKVGIEGAYAADLVGAPGKEIEQWTSTGWKKTGRYTVEPVEGADVVTSFDKDIQEVAHSELERQLKISRAESGTVILMEVSTGFIKAVVNLSLNKDSTFSESFNYAIAGREVPGSTFKLASLMAGLEDNKFKLTDKLNAKGNYKIYNKVYRDANQGKGYGMLTVQEAFEKSSNVIAPLLYNSYINDPENFMKRLGEFGLLNPLGIEIPGELGPKFYKPGDTLWSPLSIPSIAIGYEYQQTPLHMCAFYNAVANKGKFLKPLFVKEIRKGGITIKSFQPTVIKEKICSDKTLNSLISCLKGVMIKGTGVALKTSQFSIAGKTGTSHFPGKNKGYSDNPNDEVDYQTAFAGFFPADNPIYTCVVIISKPKGEKRYAAQVAGPVFVAIANKIFSSSLNYHQAINETGNHLPSSPKVMVGQAKEILSLLKRWKIPVVDTKESDWVVSDTLNKQIILNRRQLIKAKVPDVTGMSAKDAVYLLESMGLVVQFSGYGSVTSQSLAPGTELFKGMLIKIELK